MVIKYRFQYRLGVHNIHWEFSKNNHTLPPYRILCLPILIGYDDDDDDGDDDDDDDETIVIISIVLRIYYYK